MAEVAKQVLKRCFRGFAGGIEVNLRFRPGLHRAGEDGGIGGLAKSGDPFFGIFGTFSVLGAEAVFDAVLVFGGVGTTDEL